MGNSAEPEEIASAVAFLASEHASFITASTFLVDGDIHGADVTPAVAVADSLAVGARPVIGVSAHDARATWASWDSVAALVPVAYLDALSGAGADAVVLPVGSDPEALLRRVDGLLLIGGPDVDPSRYGETTHPATGAATARRDEFELGLAASARALDLPLLAVCRGLQVLNVQRGGTLQQHLPDIAGHDGHSPASAVYGRTTVHTEAGSRLASILGAPRVNVDCAHHQAVKALGAGLVASAFAEDGTIEAIEDRGASFTLGVQWHPEVGGDLSLFRALVAAGAARRVGPRDLAGSR